MVVIVAVNLVRGDELIESRFRPEARRILRASQSVELGRHTILHVGRNVVRHSDRHSQGLVAICL